MIILFSNRVSDSAGSVEFRSGVVMIFRPGRKTFPLPASVLGSLGLHVEKWFEFDYFGIRIIEIQSINYTLVARPLKERPGQNARVYDHIASLGIGKSQQVHVTSSVK